MRNLQCPFCGTAMIPCREHDDGKCVVCPNRVCEAKECFVVLLAERDPSKRSYPSPDHGDA